MQKRKFTVVTQLHDKNNSQIIEYVENLEGNILVTLGSNNVPLFKDLKNLSNIYFRILSKTIRDYILCSVLEIISFCVVLSSVTN